jgi:hypothetical protein
LGALYLSDADHSNYFNFSFTLEKKEKDEDKKKKRKKRRNVEINFKKSSTLPVQMCPRGRPYGTKSATKKGKKNAHLWCPNSVT